MKKTDFLNNIIKHKLKADPNEMMLYFGDKNYEYNLLDREIMDVVVEIKKDLNDLFKIIGINSELNDLDIVSIISKNLSNNVHGSLHYDDIYEALQKKENFKNIDDEVSILRIESKNNQGFFTYLTDIGRPLSDHFDWKTEKTPGCDGLLSLYYMNYQFREKGTEHVFGFKDKEHLEKWLSENIEEGIIEHLSKEDLYVSEYKVKEQFLLETSNQVAFKKEDSKFLSRIPFDKYSKSFLFMKNDIQDDGQENINKNKPVIIYKKKKNKL